MTRRRVRLSALLSGLLCGAIACDSRTPRDDYDDFRERTETAREAGCTGGDGRGGVFADIEGRWLLNALLKGGIRVGLRVVFDLPEGSDGTPPLDMNARIWLHDQPTDAEPLVITTTRIAEDGTFELVADPLNLGTEVLESESAVIAIVNMLSRILDGDQWCGDAVGSVTSPLNLALDGSTFYARRDDDGALIVDELPFECPGDPCAADAGVEPDGGADLGVDGGPQRPASPDLSAVASARRDLTGEYFVTASLNGIPARLWLSVIYRESMGEDGVLQAGIDGALRSVQDAQDSPAAANFFAPVDADGRFEVWLPELAIAIGGLQIEGDILLGAATLDGGFCGEIAGTTRSPFELDLAGSTFFAVPWTPGSAPPAEPANTCPGADEPPAE